jgi:hypothetical protein
VAARAEAERYADEHPLPTADPVGTLQWLLSRRTSMLKVVAKLVDDLAPEDLTVMGTFGPCEHQYVRLEKDLAQEVGALCINMERVGLAERLVNIQEAKATLILRALTAAAEEQGIPRHQLRGLGPAFRRHLTLLQGGASPEGRAA